ncbi:MAG: hypothetical protein KAV41_02880 [Candidatus Pacebacteria bacterium]|nr:hypothetical protein [Candidatus Paceibacterota bacterium]
MIYILTWISLIVISGGLILLDRWVKKEAQTYALLGLVFVEISLILVLNFLK